MWIDLGASWHLKFVEFDWVLDDMTALELGVVRRMLAEDSAWSGRYLASETSGSFNAWHLRGWIPVVGASIVTCLQSGQRHWIWCWSPNNPQQVRFPMFYSNLLISSLNMTLLFLPQEGTPRINNQCPGLEQKTPWSPWPQQHTAVRILPKHFPFSRLKW